MMLVAGMKYIRVQIYNDSPNGYAEGRIDAQSFTQEWYQPLLNFYCYYVIWHKMLFLGMCESHWSSLSLNAQRQAFRTYEDN